MRFHLSRHSNSSFSFFYLRADDWGSIFGSPTKLGLGIVSASFDVFFFVQHSMFKGRGPRISRELVVGESGERQERDESEAALLPAEEQEREEE